MNKGAQYKSRTKQWLISKGYVAELIENVKMVRRGIYVKRDVLGADVIGVKGHETVLVNSVFGSTPALAKSNVSKHIRVFEQYPDGGMKRMVCIWTPYAREPEIREVDNVKA